MIKTRGMTTPGASGDAGPATASESREHLHAKGCTLPSALAFALK